MNPRTVVFLLAVALQTGLLLSIALAPAVASPDDGRGIIRLAIEPDLDLHTPEYRVVNPDFPITRPAEVPGWEDLQPHTPICVVLRPGSDGFYEVASVETAWPWWPPRDAVIVRGRLRDDGLELHGLSSYFVQPRAGSPATDVPERPHAEVTVTRDGRARIQALVIDGRRY